MPCAPVPESTRLRPALRKPACSFRAESVRACLESGLLFQGADSIARAISVTQTDKQILVLHVFIKKTQKTPQSAIQAATNRLERVNNEKP